MTTTSCTTPHPPAWDELVAAALLGTERRTPPVQPRPGRDPAAALLDEAALRTVQRRAALLPAAAGARPEAAPDDPRPPLPAAAARRLALLLADRAGSGGGRQGSAPDLTELLPQWLTAANGHGHRAPAALLPGLLDAARARSDLRSEALALAGPRGLWLARLNPQWAYALRGTAAGSAALPAAAGEQVWHEGLFAERVALLASLRRGDPAAARELLATTWAEERAEDRLMFLDTLREGVSLADEPFLEQALSDRSRNVRALAAELLSALPGSALAARMAERARACVALDVAGTREDRRIAVEAPPECDSAMQRDGVVAKPPSGRGERSWWLTQLVEAAPLATWYERLGVTDAAGAVALPVADGWQPDLHAAWCRAAVRQRDADWARALLGPATAPPAPEGAAWRDPAKLLSALPPAERAAWVADFISAHGLSDAFRLLGVCTVPWAEPLGRAVVDALDIARDAGSYPWSFSGVMGMAERCLDPAEAGRLEVLTAVPDTESAPPGAAGYWAEAFRRLVGTLRLRGVMHEELAGPTA
ncbi:DUF5691 domain-containing protein [Streptomyces morookaense]|uniref:Uncharacterized protein n=1 Tax=Streptomyces morookaense TaxID=1970 RepID=A0A7Y7B1K9_STRMO|nr:DUF5691 domain-containing protein [Streptomyces morookaense]NVK77170.1 hypothetical protein [Streptomyces morookaense]GHF17244.1 hypothetical protein GCM10010359_18480 [Streptomyces morookaense]